MLRSRKLMRIKARLSRLVRIQSLIKAVFEDIPELQKFSWSYSQEYDDNNYSNHVRLRTVNGWHVDWDGEYEDEDDYTEKAIVEFDENGKRLKKVLPLPLPKLEKEEIELVSQVVQEVAEDYGYQDEFTVERSSLQEVSLGEEEHFDKYVKSFVSGSVLPDEFFLDEKANLTRHEEMAEIATYYAMDHGRFSPEMEFKIFAEEGMMFCAYEHARNVIGGDLPETVENFFLLNDKKDSEDHKWLVKYLTFRGKAAVKKFRAQNVKKTRKAIR